MTSSYLRKEEERKEERKKESHACIRYCYFVSVNRTPHNAHRTPHTAHRTLVLSYRRVLQDVDHEGPVFVKKFPEKNEQLLCHPCKVQGKCREGARKVQRNKSPRCVKVSVV